MTRETMPLRAAIGRLADMHEAERDRLEAWAEEAAPKIASELGVPLDQLRPVLDAQIATHLAIVGELTEQEAVELSISEPNRTHSGDDTWKSANHE